MFFVPPMGGDTVVSTWRLNDSRVLLQRIVRRTYIEFIPHSWRVSSLMRHEEVEFRSSGIHGAGICEMSGQMKLGCAGTEAVCGASSANFIRLSRGGRIPGVR
jgi:hypothetical protein